MRELGVTTQRVLSAIVEYKRKNDGCAPSVRELRRACAISSSSVVHHHLNRLEKAGLIEREANEPRSIRVVGGEWKLN